MGRFVYSDSKRSYQSKVRAQIQIYPIIFTFIDFCNNEKAT